MYIKVGITLFYIMSVLHFEYEMSQHTSDPLLKGTEPLGGVYVVVVGHEGADLCVTVCQLSDKLSLFSSPPRPGDKLLPP